MKRPEEIGDYTEREFIEFIEQVTDFDNIKSERQANELNLKFHRVCPHPAGAALIYYPEAEGLDTPENIVKIIREWCAANGKPGFKPE